VVEPSAIVGRSSSANPAKLKKVIKTLIKRPDLKVAGNDTYKILRQGGCRSLHASLHPAISPRQDGDGLEGASGSEKVETLG